MNITVDDPTDLSSLLLCKKEKGSPNNAPTTTSQESSGIVLSPYVSPKIQITTMTTTTTTVGISHAGGRGLVALEDIVAGECLFVIPPIVEAAVDVVYKQWMATSSHYDEDSAVVELERITESVLVQAMKDAMASTDQRPIAQSFLALMGASASDVNCLSINRLLGKEDDDDDCGANDATEQTPPPYAATSELRQIIRRNAFGPDFVTYQVIAKRWMDNESSSSSPFMPTRILGLYPLAAMINHSCCPNAVRVFCNVHGINIMMAHASERIPAGTELVWSYIPPTQAYPTRQKALLEQHKFNCSCRRCGVEKQVWENKDSPVKAALENILGRWTIMHFKSAPLSDAEMKTVVAKAVKYLEDEIMTHADVSNNELRSFLRVGFMKLYIQYINDSPQPAFIHDDKTKQELESMLRLCTTLHFSFCTSDNGSTEHLSILHICFEYMGRLHTSAQLLEKETSNTLPKVQFWTEQVKRACMIRYGNLGNNLETVRTVMTHSRTLFREKNGIDKAAYSFI